MAQPEWRGFPVYLSTEIFFNSDTKTEPLVMFSGAVSEFQLPVG